MNWELGYARPVRLPVPPHRCWAAPENWEPEGYGARATVSVDDHIATWLDEIGLGQYATVFAENAIDLEVLPDVTETDLERLGVALGHRKRILRAIAALSGATPAAAAPP